MNVVATARLQFGPDLTFAGAAAVVPYLAELGISHLYLSPVFAARPGSAHGYDVVDPTRVSEALGGREGLEQLARIAHGEEMGMILDIVPNHLAADEHNPWWWSVLRDGQASPYASVFDLDWRGNEVVPAGKLALPVLGAPLPAELARGAIRFDTSAEPAFRYADRRFPLAPGTAHGDLSAALDRQHYVLTAWRDASRVRSYRRFLDIDDLVGVRVEDPVVFARTHALVLELVRTGIADGLRVDHVDGLTDPAGYLERLRSVIGPDVYVVVEKILGRDEELPSWPVEGTTGYDALGELDAVFVDRAGLEQLDREYLDAGGRPFGEVVLEAKALVLDETFWPELDRSATDLAALAGVGEPRAREIVRTLTCHLDVYRTYARAGVWSAEDWARVAAVLEHVGPERHAVERVLRRPDPDAADWVTRWQQLSAAVMATGYENTALYRHTRLLALNEVGGDPLGPLWHDAPARWHDANARRRERSPASMVTTTTHDTKRGEDTRARLIGLCEATSAWHTLVDRLQSEFGCDRDTTGLVAQSVLGGWPAADPEWPAFTERLSSCLRKSLREAKVRTSWRDPDPALEDAVVAPATRLVAEHGRSLRERCPVLLHQLEQAGLVYALGRTVLKQAAPGVPDLYQGADRWELTFVDPDNRRPVDWASRASTLTQWSNEEPDPAELLDRWRDGTVKQWVTWCTLRARADDPALFLDADYLPLSAQGSFADHVVAFARVGNDGRVAVAVAARAVVALADGGPLPLGDRWDDTVLVVPQEVVVRDALRPRALPITASQLPLAELFAELPTALLIGRAAP